MPSLASLTLNRYDITPFQFKKWPERNVRLTYIEAINILREAGETQLGDYDDINTAQEKKLGAIVKDRFGTDFFSVHR
jgi:aspartyl-tRNA synthetase